MFFGPVHGLGIEPSARTMCNGTVFLDDLVHMQATCQCIVPELWHVHLVQMVDKLLRLFGIDGQAAETKLQ